jgi:trk system potassium uptake protein
LTTTGASILSDVESTAPFHTFLEKHDPLDRGYRDNSACNSGASFTEGYRISALQPGIVNEGKDSPEGKGRGLPDPVLIYVGITALETVFLLLGGMDLFDSLCNSFGTVATGGFSTRNTSIADYSPYLQYVIAIFMLLSAVSYVVFYHLLKGSFRRVRSNEELWFYLFTVTAAVTAVTVILYTGTDRNFSLSFRHAFFRLISQISCSGFATTDYMAFPPLGWFILFLLMFSGGSTGSTTGGIKIARHLIFFKNLRNSFIRLHHPNAVIPVKLNGQGVPEGVVNQTMVFISLYFVIFLPASLSCRCPGYQSWNPPEPLPPQWPT